MQSKARNERPKGGDYEWQRRQNQDGNDGNLRKMRDKNVPDYGNEKIEEYFLE